MEEFERGQRVVIGDGVQGTVVKAYTTAREERMVVVRREDGEKVWCLATEVHLAPQESQQPQSETQGQAEADVGIARLDEEGRVPSLVPVGLPEGTTLVQVNGNLVAVAPSTPHDEPLANPPQEEVGAGRNPVTEIDVSRLRWMASRNGRWFQVTDLVLDSGVLMVRISSGDPDPGLVVPLDELQ